MHFETYQTELEAIQKAYPKGSSQQSADRLASLSLGLAEESGEVVGLIKRLFRGDLRANDDFRVKLSKELGDTLAYLTLLGTYFDIELNQIALQNLEKLNKRIANNTSLGQGSDR